VNGRVLSIPRQHSLFPTGAVARIVPVGIELCSKQPPGIETDSNRFVYQPTITISRARQTFNYLGLLSYLLPFLPSCDGEKKRVGYPSADADTLIAPAFRDFDLQQPMKISVDDEIG
jgi:hypothetical protein